MIGDIIAAKRTLTLQWEWLSETNKQLIESALSQHSQMGAGVTIAELGRTTTISAYRTAIPNRVGQRTTLSMLGLISAQIGRKYASHVTYL